MTFHGFPKANTGVMPECARTHKVIVIFEDIFQDRKFTCSNKPFCVDDNFEWSGAFGDPSCIRGYIPTDIPLEVI